MDDTNVPHPNYAKCCFKSASIEDKKCKFWVRSVISAARRDHMWTLERILEDKKKDTTRIKRFTD